jgi:hypothetical protein
VHLVERAPLALVPHPLSGVGPDELRKLAAIAATQITEQLWIPE